MRIFPLVLLLILPFCSLASQANTDTSLTPALYKTLNEIQDQLSAQEYEQVAARLTKLEEDLKPSFGLALVYQLHGQFWLLQEKPEKGLEFFQKALELNVLAPAQEAGIATTAAQILLSLDRADDAYNDLEPRLKRILAKEKEDNDKPRKGRRYKENEGDEDKQIRYIQPHSFVTAATACQMKKRYDKSIPWLKQAVSRSETPKENWLLMLMVALYQEKQYAASIEVLDDLIRLNPSKEDYWQQQAALYQILEQPNKALRTLELGYAGGYIEKPTTIMQLVQLLINNGIPERAGRILQKHLNDESLELNDRNWKILASAWQQSREHAKAAVALIEASEYMEDGSLIYRAAQLQLQIGEYRNAIDNAKKAIKKGLNEKDESNALMLVASSAYELNEYDLSRQYFQRALQFANTASSAKNWLDYLAALEESHKLASQP